MQIIERMRTLTIVTKSDGINSGNLLKRKWNFDHSQLFAVWISHINILNDFELQITLCDKKILEIVRYVLFGWANFWTTAPISIKIIGFDLGYPDTIKIFFFENDWRSRGGPYIFYILCCCASGFCCYRAVVLLLRHCGETTHSI